MKYIFIIIFSILMAGCLKQKEEIEIQPAEEKIAEHKTILKNFSYEDVAKYVIATIMSQSSDIMSAEKDSDLYVVSYTRKSDKQKFVYKLKFDNDIVTWANIDGRWRDGQYDEKIMFEEVGEILKINTIYSDGSKDTKEFHK